MFDFISSFLPFNILAFPYTFMDPSNLYCYFNLGFHHYAVWFIFIIICFVYYCLYNLLFDYVSNTGYKLISTLKPTFYFVFSLWVELWFFNIVSLYIYVFEFFNIWLSISLLALRLVVKRSNFFIFKASFWSSVNLDLFYKSFVSLFTTYTSIVYNLHILNSKNIYLLPEENLLLANFSIFRIFSSVSSIIFFYIRPILVKFGLLNYVKILRVFFNNNVLMIIATIFVVFLFLVKTAFFIKLVIFILFAFFYLLLLINLCTNVPYVRSNIYFFDVNSLNNVVNIFWWYFEVKLLSLFTSILEYNYYKSATNFFQDITSDILSRSVLKNSKEYNFYISLDRKQTGNFRFNDFYIVQFFLLFTKFKNWGSSFFNIRWESGKERRFKHSLRFELVWVFVPLIVIFLLLVPSLIILYQWADTQNPILTVQVVANQWYWVYSYIFPFAEANDALFEFSSYMVPETNWKVGMGSPRLLTVDNALIIPADLPVRYLITSADVLHAWTLPSWGVKIDAVPGRLTQAVCNTMYPGVFFGQCSELCGVEHGFMPITVVAHEISDFYDELHTFFSGSLNPEFYLENQFAVGSTDIVYESMIFERPTLLQYIDEFVVDFYVNLDVVEDFIYPISDFDEIDGEYGYYLSVYLYPYGLMHDFLYFSFPVVFEETETLYVVLREHLFN